MLLAKSSTKHSATSFTGLAVLVFVVKMTDISGGRVISAADADSE